MARADGTVCFVAPGMKQQCIAAGTPIDIDQEVVSWTCSGALISRSTCISSPCVLGCALFVQVLAYNIYDEGESVLFDRNVAAFLNITAADLDMLIK
jgi:hypothetical protein